MSAWTDPFFWAFISMLGLVGACSVVGTRKLGTRPLLGLAIVSVFFIGRFLLVMPFCPQPRFEVSLMTEVAGWVAFVLGILFGLGPCLQIKPLTIADSGTALRTTGFYKVTRNPIYLGELLWCFGWSLLNRSIIGVALIPLWWAGLLCLILIEEESLERALGQAYRDFKARKRGRILPGLPF